MASSHSEKAHTARVAKGEKEKADKAAKAEKAANLKSQKPRKAEEPEHDTDRSRSSRGMPHGPGSADGSGDDDMDASEVPGAPAASAAAPVSLESLAATIAAGIAQQKADSNVMANMMAAFTAKFGEIAVHTTKVDASLASISARLDGQAARLDSQAADMAALKADRGGQSSSSSAADKRWSPPPAASSRPPNRASPAAVPEYIKVFFVGADYALSRAALGRYWNGTVKPLVGAPLTSDSRPFIGDNASFSIGFPTEAAAKDFIAALEDVVVPPLVDPDDHSHFFKFHLQRSKVPTKYGRQLSYLHQHYHTKLCDREGYGTDFKLTTDAHRGRVYLTRGDRLFMLHSVNTDGATLRSYEDGINEFKLDLADSRAAAQLFAAA